MTSIGDLRDHLETLGFRLSVNRHVYTLTMLDRTLKVSPWPLAEDATLFYLWCVEKSFTFSGVGVVNFSTVEELDLAVIYVGLYQEEAT